MFPSFAVGSQGSITRGPGDRPGGRFEVGSGKFNPQKPVFLSSQPLLQLFGDLQSQRLVLLGVVVDIDTEQ